MSKSKQIVIAILFFTIVATMTFVFFHSSQKQIGNPSVQSVELPLENSKLAPASQPSFSAGNLAKPPSVSDIRAEVRLNPHESPTSLLRFAADLGARMKEARQSQAAATALLGDLKSCSAPAELDTNPVQARALCIVTAQELAEMWPELSNEVNDLVEKADPEAVSLASKIQ